LFVLLLAFRAAEPLGLWDGRRGSGILGVLWALPIAAPIFLAITRRVAGKPSGRWLRVLVTTAGCLGVLLASCAPESKFLPYPRIDTCMAPGFELERFEELRQGMSAQDVKAVAGPPLFMRDGRWGYRVDGSPDVIWSYSGDHCAAIGDYAWQAFEVGFRNGSVVAISRRWRYD